jgi:type II secretory pathway predicted ATPase ExeA
VYTQFFGLKELPFRLRPEGGSPYPGENYSNARRQLTQCLQDGSRVCLLLAPAGAGKTTLLDDLLAEMGSQITLCRINQPQLSPSELLEAFLLQIAPSGIEQEPRRARAFAEFTAELGAVGSRASTVLLVIDDAQALSPGTVPALTEILARMATARILLSARAQGRVAEFIAERLLPKEMLQRISLSPLSAGEISAYIEFRLAAAGASRKDLFTTEAVALIFTHTQGSLRLINVLCDAAMRTACLRASGQIGSTEVTLATQEARWAESLAREHASSAAAEFDGGETSVGWQPPTATPERFSLQQSLEESAAFGGELVLSFEGRPLSRWPLAQGRLRIGRAGDNDLRIEDQAISRYHCTVTTEGESSCIEDLNSVNGLLVNGRKVKRHELSHADRVHIGEHIITYLLRS